MTCWRSYVHREKITVGSDYCRNAPPEILPCSLCLTERSLLQMGQARSAQSNQSACRDLPIRDDRCRFTHLDQVESRGESVRLRVRCSRIALKTALTKPICPSRKVKYPDEVYSSSHCRNALLLNGQSSKVLLNTGIPQTLVHDGLSAVCMFENENELLN